MKLKKSAASIASVLSGITVAFFKAFIICYKYIISPFIPNSCRFYPSCSSYAIDALNKFGPLRGSAIAAFRLLKCNTLSPGGYDPVLPHKHK